MASAPADPGEVRGLVDRAGRLLEADPALARVQREAGAALGENCALPQLAGLARLAFRLGIAVERPAMIAGDHRDIDLWVRAEPKGDHVALTLQRWTERPAASSRLSSLSIVPDALAAPAPDLGWALDPELRITALTGELAAALGVEVDAAVGLPLTRVVQLLEEPSGDLPLLSALSARRGFTGQRVRARSGERELHLSGELKLDPGGAFAGFEGGAKRAGPDGVATSSTTRARSDAIAAEALDDVLRSPLDRIIAEAERITNRSDGPLRSDYASYGNDIVAAARHLMSVIEAMGEERQAGHGPVDLAALAAEAVMLVEPVAEERGVTIDLAPATAMTASGEERAIIQILVNLITNAVRHSPANSAVRVEFEQSGEWRTVIVADQGPGIAAADQHRIFERFEQVDAGSGGSGLGLAIARRLARTMRGDVTVDSAAGAGARFRLELPIA